MKPIDGTILTNLTNNETWTLTMQLRNLVKVNVGLDGWVNTETVLQQLHISNLGREEWVDVSTITEVIKQT